MGMLNRAEKSILFSLFTKKNLLLRVLVQVQQDNGGGDEGGIEGEREKGGREEEKNESREGGSEVE